MRAVLKYPGSKWSLADWIIRFFPEHHSYLELFFGSGTVLFNKPRSNIETYIAIRKLTPKECFRLQGWEDVYYERAAMVNSNSRF